MNQRDFWALDIERIDAEAPPAAAGQHVANRVAHVDPAGAEDRLARAVGHGGAAGRRSIESNLQLPEMHVVPGARRNHADDCARQGVVEPQRRGREDDQREQRGPRNHQSSTHQDPCAHERGKHRLGSAFGQS